METALTLWSLRCRPVPAYAGVMDLIYKWIKCFDSRGHRGEGVRQPLADLYLFLHLVVDLWHLYSFCQSALTWSVVIGPPPTQVRQLRRELHLNRCMWQ